VLSICPITTTSCQQPPRQRCLACSRFGVKSRWNGYGFRKIVSWSKGIRLDCHRPMAC
jgi:hypothetical protein